ncbi:MAG: site-specific integrase [Acidobacteria bacterium]|nr:site-specific integrase [Acidobacteriota bacterium]
MNDPKLLGPWVRRFLMEYMLTERNLSINTQHSYRDTLALLISFLSRSLRRTPDQFSLADLTAERIKSFLRYLEESRRCGIRTRNQRLSAIHSLARFVEMHSPEHIAWSAQILAIPIKKTTRNQITYLEKPEMEALIQAPNIESPLGCRDRTLLLFLYNSGARAGEVAQLTIADLNLARPPSKGLSSVRLMGKGRKVRPCPLWPNTASQLADLVAGRPTSEHVFLNRCGQPLTRFGIYRVVKHYAQCASKQFPSLVPKNVGPHKLRHTTATHLLRSGVDINSIREWLGHASLDTTNLYAEIDMETKAKILALFETARTKRRRRWKEDAGLMAFLRSL